MKKNKKLNSLNHYIGLISRCDVILKSGDELFIGFSYNEEYADSPYVVCKHSLERDSFFIKIAEMIGIPCIEQKILARELYENLDEGDILPAVYISSVAKIYSNLEKFKDCERESAFQKSLNKDIHAQLDCLEKTLSKRISRNIDKKKKNGKDFEGDLVRYYHEELCALAEKYQTFQSASFHTEEFFLEVFYERFSIGFWQIVLISEKEKKIYVGTKSLFRSFSIDEAEIAVNFIKELVEGCNTELKDSVQKYCEEFQINPRLYDIAHNSILAMLELNYEQTGIEYGYATDTAVFVIYLKTCSEQGVKMYQIVITYNEFLRHPDVLKEFIKSPKIMKKWNFWCRERKYNQKYLDKKFQTISQ